MQERASGAAHLQRAAGCGAAAYWGGHAAWDAATHGLLSLLTLAIFAAYGDGATTGNADKVQLVAHLRCASMLIVAQAMKQTRAMPVKALGTWLLYSVLARHSAQSSLLDVALVSVASPTSLAKM